MKNNYTIPGVQAAPRGNRRSTEPRRPIVDDDRFGKLKGSKLIAAAHEELEFAQLLEAGLRSDQYIEPDRYERHLGDESEAESERLAEDDRYLFNDDY